MKVGEIQKLKVGRVSDYGLYLVDDEQNEVLLPNRYVSLAQHVGDEAEVFVYHDSEDRIVATTETPKIKAGEVACLKVVDKNIHGAFLDWGVGGKDLFMPNRNQQGGIVIGNSYAVYMYVDNVTGRCVATNKLKGFVNNDDIVTVAPRQEVGILVVSESPIGYRVIVENRHWGMIYKNQLFRKVEIGERCRAYVVRVTEDNRIDLSLQRQGYAPGEGFGGQALRNDRGERRIRAAYRRQFAGRGTRFVADEQETVQAFFGRIAEPRSRGDCG